jgi:uncharacterized surface protein with fasciclin (FAS1) repeats
MGADDAGTPKLRETSFRQMLLDMSARLWKALCAIIVTIHAINFAIIVRLCKYAVLLCGVILTLKVVFDAYSFYVARRDIDAELRSKKVSSLEYLNVLSQRQRALAVTTLEARCLQRTELALFRIFDAAEYERIEKVYTELLEQKNRMHDVITKSGKDPLSGKDLIEIEKAGKLIEHPYFQLSKLDDYLKPLNDEAAKNPAYHALKDQFRMEKDKYVAIAVANLPLRERLARANDYFPKEVYNELVNQKNNMRDTIKNLGRQLIDVNGAVRYIDSPEFVLSRLLDDHLKPLDKQAEASADYKKLIEEIKSHRDKFVEFATKEFANQNASLPEEVERLIRTRQPPPPMYWNLDGIKIVVERIDQLREERKATKDKIGGDLDDLLARYAVWTGALTGGTADNPVLDDVAYQIGKDDALTLKNQNCRRFEDYYAAVNGKILRASPTEEPSFWKLTWTERFASISRFYSQYLLIYFNQPPAAQTLFVTMFLGALGALTLNLLRMSKVGWWEDQKDPLWGEIFVGPLLGSLAAFGIFLIGSSGLLLTTDTSGGAQPLSAYFIGLLGFLSGLLYDEAFGRVRRVGIQIFATKAGEEAANVRTEDRSLAETLKGSSASLAAGLVLKYGIGTRISAESEFTLLIPSDEAMGRIPLTTWTKLNDSQPEFEKWYKWHHAAKRIAKADVAGGGTTAAVSNLSIDDDTSYALALDGGEFKINNVRVLIADVIWNKGVIHILSEELP